VDHLCVDTDLIDEDILGDWPTEQCASPDVEPRNWYGLMISLISPEAKRWGDGKAESAGEPEVFECSEACRGCQRQEEELSKNGALGMALRERLPSA
jgi:hypothetical protein